MADAEAPRTTEAKQGGGKLVPLLLVVNSVLLAAVLALLVLRPGGLGKHDAKADKGDEHAEAHGEKGKAPGEPLPGPTMRLPDFVVHLRDADADRYARVAFELELADGKAKDAVTARMPQIRDAFLSYLSDRSADDLRGSEAMAKLKGALAQRIGEIAPGAAVRGLYVADLVVQ